MIKQVFAALAGLALCVPGQARIEDGTYPLLELMDSSGIAVSFNGDDCDDGQYLGVYKHAGMKRAMVLCPGADVDAQDHMVVRHEAIHAIQHCVNVARGTSVLTAIVDDDDELMEFVYQHLSKDDVERIKQVYPMDQWRIEFEAFAGMHAFTSEELAEMFTSACLFTETDA